MILPNKRCFDSDALYWLSTSSGVKITQQGFLFLDSPVILNAPSYNQNIEIPDTEMKILSIFDYKNLSVSIDNSNSDADDSHEFELLFSAVSSM